MLVGVGVGVGVADAVVDGSPLGETTEADALTDADGVVPARAPGETATATATVETARPAVARNTESLLGVMRSGPLSVRSQSPRVRASA
jgi:hypothetical protein